MQKLEPVISEGKTCVASIRQLADKVSAETAEAGQQQLQQQVHQLTDFWNTASESLASLRSTLENHLHACNDLESLCEDLTSWLREKETEVEKLELKSTLDEKRAVLNQLMVCSVIINCVYNFHATSFFSYWKN